MNVCARRHAFVFPGQGSQRVGMGAFVLGASSGARDVFAEASDVLGWDVAALCSEGPAARLRETQNTQIAVHVTNLAFSVAIIEAGINSIAAAGHSVGEISALSFAGALTIGDSTRLVAERGRLMATIAHSGGLLSVVGLRRSVLLELVDELRGSNGLLEVVADNAPGHGVVAGSTAELREFRGHLAGCRGVRTVPLQASGAFHSVAYEPLLPEWEAVVSSVDLRQPRRSFVSSVTGRVVSSPNEIRSALTTQLTTGVRWREAVQAISALGATCLIEAGEGVTVSRLAQLTLRQTTTNCSTAWRSRLGQAGLVART
jgi:[acyl-carrier-protein] S-malonyltransferase